MCERAWDGVSRALTIGKGRCVEWLEAVGAAGGRRGLTVGPEIGRDRDLGEEVYSPSSSKPFSASAVDLLCADSFIKDELYLDDYCVSSTCTNATTDALICGQKSDVNVFAFWFCAVSRKRTFRAVHLQYCTVSRNAGLHSEY